MCYIILLFIIYVPNGYLAVLNVLRLPTTVLAKLTSHANLAMNIRHAWTRPLLSKRVHYLLLLYYHHVLHFASGKWPLVWLLTYIYLKLFLLFLVRLVLFFCTISKCRLISLFKVCPFTILKDSKTNVLNKIWQCWYFKINLVFSDTFHVGTLVWTYERKAKKEWGRLRAYYNGGGGTRTRCIYRGPTIVKATVITTECAPIEPVLPLYSTVESGNTTASIL